GSRLSSSRTRYPAVSRRSARWEPRNPAPPVIRTRGESPLAFTRLPPQRRAEGSILRLGRSAARPRRQNAQTRPARRRGEGRRNEIQGPGARGEAQRKREIELGQRAHLPVEPSLGTRAVPVGPTQSGAQVAHAEPLQPRNGLVKAGIFEMEPLTNSHALGEAGAGGFGAAVGPNEAHVVMAVIG